MSRYALFLALWTGSGLAAADDAGSGNSPMYLIGISVKEVDAIAEGGENAKILAAPKVATVENREAIFHVGGQTNVAEETVRWGTRLKVKLKKLNGGKVRLTGVLEVSSVAEPTDDFVERLSTEYHFARTVSLGEKACLGKRQRAEGYRVVELTCEKVDALEPAWAKK